MQWASKKDCWSFTPSTPYKYIVWVGGIDDHYTNLLDAEVAVKEWKSKGYDDVQLETIN